MNADKILMRICVPALICGGPHGASLRFSGEFLVIDRVERPTVN